MTNVANLIESSTNDYLKLDHEQLLSSRAARLKKPKKH